MVHRRAGRPRPAGASGLPAATFPPMAPTPRVPPIRDGPPAHHGRWRCRPIWRLRPHHHVTTTLIPRVPLVDTRHRPTRSAAALAAGGILTLVILAPALLSFGSSNASGLSPHLADAPAALVPLAFQAGATTGIDGNLLLAIAK